MSRWHEERAGAQGFTLLELLVAITLLGLLMATLFGGLRLGARVWETGETRLDAAARIQIVQDLVRQRLAQALPLEAPLPEEGDGYHPLFVGRVDSVRFASLLPEHLGADIALIELALAESDDAEGTTNVVLRWRPFEPDVKTAEGGEDTLPDAAPEERVLLERVEALELAYFGALGPGELPDWWQAWEGQVELPQLVSLRVRFAEDDPRRWPELVVHPMIDQALTFQF
jgi:general secretion pathway protein J